LKNIVIILAVLLLTDCYAQKEDKLWFLNEKSERITKIKFVFTDSLINHFPLKEDVKKHSYTWAIGSETENNLILTVNESYNFANYSKLFKSNNIAVYNSNDDCLLILNRFANQENYGVIKYSDIDQSEINQDCYNSLYPIPNFWINDYYTDKTVCHLPNDFEIYVIEAKPRIFPDRKPLTQGKLMPKKWKNGYSKGVAINEENKVIIYWVIIW